MEPGFARVVVSPDVTAAERRCHRLYERSTRILLVLGLALASALALVGFTSSLLLGGQLTFALYVLPPIVFACGLATWHWWYTPRHVVNGLIGADMALSLWCKQLQLLHIMANARIELYVPSKHRLACYQALFATLFALSTLEERVIVLSQSRNPGDQMAVRELLAERMAMVSRLGQKINECSEAQPVV